MPYTAKQNALFRAAANNPDIAKTSGIPQEVAKTLASEGVRKIRNKLAEKAAQ